MCGERVWRDRPWFARPPNADNAGGRLVLYAHYGPPSPPARHEQIVALEEAPGSYDEAAFRTPPHRYDHLYCGSSLYGNLSAARVRKWMAYHARFFGLRSHFVFHDAGGVSPAVCAALQDVRAQAAYDGWYYNQFLVVNDCLQRYRHAAKWTFFFDATSTSSCPTAARSGRPRRARAVHAVHHRAEPHVESVVRA
ncbi:hypothetical protein ACP70R_044066 [Stipagrostis hirtigluma subsp. patula]